jgi:hypothetical protein
VREGATDVLIAPGSRDKEKARQAKRSRLRRLSSESVRAKLWASAERSCRSNSASKSWRTVSAVILRRG